jgi:hypothetical protein
VSQPINTPIPNLGIIILPYLVPTIAIKSIREMAIKQIGAILMEMNITAKQKQW